MQLISSYELLIVIALLPLILLSKRLHGSWMNPITIFSGIWLLQALLLVAGPMVYVAISLKTALLVISMHVVFFVCYFVVWLSLAKHFSDTDHCSEMQRLDLNVIFWLTALSSILGLVGLGMIIMYLFSTGEIVIMLTAPYTFRDMCLNELIEFPFISHLFSTFPIAGVGLGGIYLALATKRRWVILLPLFVIVAISMVDAGKALIVWTLGVMLGTYGYTKFVVRGEHLRWKDLKQVAVACLAFLVVMMSISAYRLKAADDIIEYQQDLYDIPYRYGKDFKALFPVIDIMNYIAISLPSLSLYLEEPDFEEGNGTYTFKPVGRYLLDQEIDSRFDFVMTPVPSNIFTIIHELLIDFGYGGMWCFIGFLAGLSALLHRRIQGRMRYFSLVVMSFVTCYLFYSVFLSITYSTKYWLALLMMLVSYPLIVERVDAATND